MKKGAPILFALLCAICCMAQGGPGYGVIVKVRSSETGVGKSGPGVSFSIAMYAPGSEQDKYVTCLLGAHKITECHAPFTTAIDYSVPDNGEATFGYIEPNKSYVVVAANNATGAWHAFRVTAIDRPVSVDIGVPHGGPTFH